MPKQTTTTDEFGLNFTGGILADFFGLPTKLKNGKIVLQDKGGFSGTRATPLDTLRARGVLDSTGGETGRSFKGGQLNLRTSGQFADQIFGKDEFGNPVDTSGVTGFSNIINFLNPNREAVQTGRSLFRDAAAGQKELFRSGATSLADLINSGGSPTDISGIVNQSLADLTERFSSQGFGTVGTSSDTSNAALDIVSQLQFQAEEAARQRQLQGIGLAQTFGQSGADAANSIFRGLEDVSDEGLSRDLLTFIKNLETGNFIPGGTTTKTKDSPADFIPSLTGQIF